MDYLWKASTAWFMGFFPLAEIYVAVPAAVALGLDDISIIIWTVFGNFTPALLLITLHQQLMRHPRIGGWLQGLVSEKAQVSINRWGTGFVLLATPWLGIWVMTITAKLLQMQNGRFLIGAFVSIFMYAVGLLILIRAGLSTVT